MQHLQSKTIVGLVGILTIAVGMTFLGKLTPELVEVLRWIGSAFMGVRIAANITEGMKPK